MPLLGAMVAAGCDIVIKGDIVQCVTDLIFSLSFASPFTTYDRTISVSFFLSLMHGRRAYVFRIAECVPDDFANVIPF